MNFKMVKIILEKEDIEELIKAKYMTAEIVSGLDDKLEVLIRVKEITPTVTINSPQIPQPLTVVRDEHGNIDADKSGLTLTNRKVTKPGKEMERVRGRLPIIG